MKIFVSLIFLVVRDEGSTFILLHVGIKFVLHHLLGFFSSKKYFMASLFKKKIQGAVSRMSVYLGLQFCSMDQHAGSVTVTLFKT